ncbi:uncharacterized protein PG998_012931 [Apiospora kogelbergensis]|uniref:uncharacterized protein n=1 Tax=Apiospora kogelbergensis TaxID=1337665 RepID=UPI003130A358
MRAAVFGLAVFWVLAIASPLSKLNKPTVEVEYLNIGTPERIAKATEIVNKRYQEAADRTARGLPEKTKNITHPLNATSAKDIVYCKNKPQINKKEFETTVEVFKDWCDTDDGRASSFHHRYYDHGGVRVALCNWGFWNPCRSEELDSAWTALDLACSENGGSGGADGETVSAGLWYRSAWLKGYFRTNCATGDLCDGDRTKVPCYDSGD